jgi:predicted Fe-Mo cluster-binding NifX family protein
MNSNVINTVCVSHTPNKSAISVIAHDFDSADYFTFCEVCEQNIKSFSYYDEDCGTRYSKWIVGK